MDSTLKGRFPNLNQTKSKQLLSFYHDCMLRVFDNHASRKSEYLGDILLSTAKSGDVPKLCKALEKVDLTKVDFNLKEKNTEKTPLMIAAEHGHDQIIEILLSCGSDVTLRNAGGCTVLENASEKITELILDSVNSRQGAGQPLLCQAAWQGNATVVKKLLHLNPSLNVNSKNCEGLTPLLLVTRDLDLFDAIKLNIFTESYNPTEVVSLLLHRNADCTAVDKDGRSALHLTARNHGTNARNIISLLARKDSLNVDLRDSQDCSALHCASETGDPNVLLALIDNGADVNARGPLGRTPLHVTASRGDERTSVILVEHGANVLFIDDLGFTPVDVAKGRNVQLLLKQAWREHARTSPDSARIKSAPVVLPVKLDHLDSPDVTDLMINKDESGEPLKKALKKSSKRLQSRSHSEEQAQPSTSSGLSKRIRSYSSGPSPRSRLDPIKRENPLSDEGRASPSTQKTIVGKTTPSPANVGISKTPQTEIVPRPIARVAVLNIDLKGHDLRIKQKSKSCSELPFTRYRVHKLSNPRASLEIEPLSNPLSLRGRSVSAVPFSSFDTLPGITSEDADDDGENELSPLPDTSPVPEIVITPSAEGPDLPPGDDCPSSPETDVLNKTFNLKEKPVFLFPNDTGTNTSREVQNSERGFFVDWKTLEIPLQKCARCREYFKPEDIKRGTSVCNLCYKDSIAKDTFWVPFGTDERKRKSGTRSVYPVDPSTKSATQTAGLNELNLQPGTHSQNVDDRTICIDKETLNVLRRKNLSEGSLDSTKSKESERSPETQEYFSDTSYNHKTSASKSQDSKTSDVQVQTNNDTEEMNGFAPDSDCSKSSLVATQHSNERLVQASQNDYERKPEADEIPLVKTDSFSTKNNQDLCKNTEESTEKNTEKILCSSVAEIVCKNEDVSPESDVRSLGNALQTKHNVKTANIHSSIVKEFEECKKTLECLCTDMMCLEKKDIPDDVIGRLYNQSMTKKGVMQEGSDTGYSGATMMKKGQLGFQGEAVKVVDSKQEFLDESKKDVSIIQTMDSERSSGVEIDANGLSGIEMDETSKININTIDHLGTEVVNSDVSSHQIVIVNPFPSPVPPKIPIVNVSSSCQCDRYASFAKNTGMGGKKKGRAKKGTGTSGQKTVTNAQNTKKTVVKKDTSKQNTRVVSAGKKSKKKLKELPNANVKEISVIQKELKCDTNEENDAIPQIAIISAPGRETTFIKEKCTALSPIPESGSSVQDTASDVCLSKDNNEIPSGKDRDKDIESSLPSGKDLDIPPSRHENGDNDVALTVPSRLMESNPGHSRASNSALSGKVSETDGNLDEMIEEILNETDELENNLEEPHFSNSSNTQKYELSTETHTDVGSPASNTKTLSNSDDNVDMNYQSKTALVSNWLLGQNSGLLPYSLESSENRQFSLGSNLDSSGSNRNFSDNCRGSSGYLASLSGNCEDSSDLPRTIRSDTTPTDASPSDSSSDDTSANTRDSSGNVTSGCDDFNGEKKPETSSESISKKPIISGTQSEHWTTSSMAISFPTSNALSVNGEVCNHAEELVHSRLSRLKSETSVASLEMTNSDHYSEEEDIVWKKGNMLGKGAFGEVYCGLTDTGQMIAVKQVELITSNMEQAERQYEKLQEEVALLKSLQHKNVVSYLGTCLDGGVVNIFMEFVPGGSIASILARFGALEESVFRLYTKQILVGVEYLHKKNVVHRDIKGGNIMLMPTGVIKLIDFGCAKRLYMNMSQSQGNLLRSMKGTPYWMAPEVIRETGYGRKSDIWSIGCTVFEMATGKPPWSHMTPMSAILAIGQGSEPPKLDKPNSDDACDFVASSMSPDPDERWSAEELLAHPFIRKCDGQR